MITSDPRVNRVLQYIDSNVHHALSLDLLSSVANMSRFHFSRVFRKCVGEPAKSYVRRVKLEKANADIVLTEAKISDVAQHYGFKNHATFTRAFKSLFGSSPSQQRSIKAGHYAHSIAPVYQIEEFYNSNLMNSVELGRVALKWLSDKTVHCVRIAEEKNSLLLSWLTLIKAVGQDCFANTANQKLHVFSGFKGTKYTKQRHDCCIELVSGEVLPNIEKQVIPASLYAVLTISVKSREAGWLVPLHQDRLLLERHLVNLVSSHWAQAYRVRVIDSPCFSMSPTNIEASLLNDSESFELFIPVEKLP